MKNNDFKERVKEWQRSTLNDQDRLKELVKVLDENVEDKDDRRKYKRHLFYVNKKLEHFVHFLGYIKMFRKFTRKNPFSTKKFDKTLDDLDSYLENNLR